MQFERLLAYNFGSLGGVCLELADQGLTVITGRNEDATKGDSNGAGKSFLLEAFCWCLWGKTIRGLSGDAVVNWEVGEDCHAIVELTEGGQAYTIKRCRKMSTGKPNDLRVFQGASELTAASMAQTQEIINQLLGLDFQTFCVLMPGAGVRASEMTDKEVKGLLERLLQTETLGAAHKNCREVLKERLHTRTVVAMEKLALQTALVECNARLGELKDKASAYQETKDSQLAALSSEGVLLRSKIEAQKLIGYDPAQLDAAEIAASSQGIIVTEENDAWQARSVRLCRALKAAEALKISAASAHQQQKAILEALPTEGTCYTCSQDISVEHLEDLISRMHSACSLLATEVVMHERRISSLHAEHVKAQGAHETRQSSLERVLHMHVARVKELLVEQQEHTVAEAVKATLEEQLSKHTTRVELLVAAENPFQALIVAEGVLAYDKAALMARKLATLSLLEHEIALYEYWLEGFSPHGVRSFLLEHVTPILNSAVEKYTTLLTDGEMTITFQTRQRLRSGKWVEKFHIDVSNKRGGQSYTACSAGERARANLCIAFALGDLAAMRASKRISFRFLDEPFESVDESGTDAIMALLHDQKARFDSVFVITHQAHFKQLFPHKLTIVKRGGSSYMEEE